MRRLNPTWARSRRGMTLIEALIAIFILVVMSAMVAETLSNAIEMNELLEQRDVTTRAARVAMSKLKREIQLAYLTPNRAAVNTYQTVFVGTDENPDTLHFASMSHQRLYMNSRECDQTELTIWVDDGPSDMNGDVLYHREAPRIDEEPDEDGPVLPLAYNVRSFNLRYLDPTTVEWRDEWDTRSVDTPYRLPRAVEIGLVLIGPDPADPDRTVDVPFLTSSLLHYGDRLINANDPLAAMFQQMGGQAAGADGWGSQGTTGGAAATSRPTRAMPNGRPTQPGTKMPFTGFK